MIESTSLWTHPYTLLLFFFNFLKQFEHEKIKTQPIDSEVWRGQLASTIKIIKVTQN